jgi:hypothetical protein
VAAILESPDIVYGLSTDRVHNFISDNQKALRTATRSRQFSSLCDSDRGSSRSFAPKTV